MIRSLRNSHRHVWMATAVLLPTAMILAWLYVPNVIPVSRVLISKVDLLPIVKTSKESSRYCINIRSNNEGTAWQLEWKNKLPLTVPSAVIYDGSSRGSDISGFGFIGRIESKGAYVFALPATTTLSRPVRLFLYDFIHEKMVDSVRFDHPL